MVIWFSWTHHLSASSLWCGATYKDHSKWNSGNLSVWVEFSLSGCQQRSRLRPAFTQPTAWRPITAGRALLPLQMLTNSPPPVARSCSFILSLSSLGSLWPLRSDIQLIVLDDMNCVNILFRLNIFNSLRQFSSKLQVLGQMYFSFKEKRLFTFYSIMDNIWKRCFFFFLFAFLSVEVWKAHVQMVFSLEKSSQVQSHAFRFPPM